MGALHHEVEAVNIGARRDAARALAESKQAREHMAAVVSLEPGEYGEYAPGQFVRCREVQSQRTVDRGVLCEAIASVSDEAVRERCARVSAAGATPDPSIEWWRCVLDGTRELGCVQSTCVLEFCETPGRQVRRALDEEACDAARRAAACAAEVREIKQRIRPEPEHDPLDIGRIQGLLEERGGALRAEVQTADGMQHVYRVTEQKTSRTKTRTPATLGSSLVVENLTPTIARLRELAPQGGAALEACVDELLARVTECTTTTRVKIKMKKL